MRITVNFKYLLETANLMFWVCLVVAFMFFVNHQVISQVSEECWGSSSLTYIFLLPSELSTVRAIDKVLARVSVSIVVDTTQSTHPATLTLYPLRWIKIYGWRKYWIPGTHRNPTISAQFSENVKIFFFFLFDVVRRTGITRRQGGD